jgi:hypothetical protein
MKYFLITLGVIILFFSIRIFKDPSRYWEWHKLNLWMQGIKDSKPTTFYLIMVRVVSFLSIILGVVAIIGGLFGNVE